MITIWTPNNENCLSQAQIDIIMKELSKLHKMYPDVVIETIGDHYSYELNEYNKTLKSLTEHFGEEVARNIMKRNGYKEPTSLTNCKGEPYESCIGQYFKNKRMILFKHDLRRKYDTLETVIEKRKKFFERYEARKKMGLEKYMLNVSLFSGRTLECVLFHEFAHALDYQYAIYQDKEMIDLYNNYTKEDIEKELNDHAAEDIHEFIAAGFEESMLGEYSKPLGKIIRPIMDRVIREGTAMSESDRKVYNLFKGIGKDNKEDE